MTPKYVDIHSHLNMSQFDSDRDDVIQKLKENNVTTITVGFNLKSSIEAIDLANKHCNLFASVGLHPGDVLIEDFNYEQMLSLATNNKVVAIGECGLDYFRDVSDEMKIKQKEIFNLHIKLALEVNKPLMVHGRPSKGTMDAYNDILDILKVYKQSNPTLVANFHFFVGDMNTAQKVIDLGFTLSFDGPITFSHDYDEVIKNTPIELIMAETDSPLVSPKSNRGKRCDPSMVVEIIQKIAELKGLSEEETLNILNNNANRVFGI